MEVNKAYNAINSYLYLHNLKIDTSNDDQINILNSLRDLSQFIKNNTNFVDLNPSLKEINQNLVSDLDFKKN